MASKGEAHKGQTQGAVEGHEGGGKKKKGLLLFAGAVVLMLALVGGGGAWFFLSGKKDAGAQAKAKPRDDHPPIYVTLDPFVVNLAGEIEHYLQVGINLKVADGKVPEQIKAHAPEIRNGVLLLLSSKHPEELATLEGKNQLRHEIRTAVNASLGVETPAAQAQVDAGRSPVGEAHASEAPAPVADEHAGGVLDVLLTSFVIQ
jgi:flagellar FliL protein